MPSLSVDLSPLISQLPTALAQWLVSFAPIFGLVAGLILTFVVVGRVLSFLQRANARGGKAGG